MSLTMLPQRISCLEDEEGGGVSLDDPSVLPEMMSYLEPRREEGILLMSLTMLPQRTSCLEDEEGGGDPLDEPRNASWEDILPGG
jgi:hypothetical protein